jgi:ferric iron reductase protein FhuF
MSTTIPSIAGTLARAAARLPYCSASYGEPADGWLLAADTLRDPAALRTLLDQVAALYRVDDRQVAASFLVLGYFWYPMYAALACFVLERRAPDLSADAVAFQFGQGVRFLTPRFSGLANDPDAHAADFTLVPDEQTLRARIVRQLEEEHAAPLFTTLRAVAPLGMHAMRANYIDRLVSALLVLAEATGDWEVARYEVPHFLRLLGAPPRAGLIEVTHAGASRPFQLRSGCCLNYRVPGLDKCDTCCLRPLDERLTLFRRHLEATAL